MENLYSFKYKNCHGCDKLIIVLHPASSISALEDKYKYNKFNI